MKLAQLLPLLFVASSAHALISANVPPGLPNYDLLDKLEAYGCALSTYRTMRPQSHLDLWGALQLGEEFPCGAPEWLLLERGILQRPALQNEATVMALAIHNDTISWLNTEAAVMPLYPLRGGRPTFDGANLYGEFSAHAQAGKDWGIALSAVPGLLFGLDEYRSLNGRGYFYEGYVKVGYKRAELTYGRQAMRFGEAKNGSLILSAAARPLDILKFAVRPHVIDSPFSWLGPFTFETWIAGGGESRYVREPRLWGVQLGFKPASWLELGFMELYQFGGVGSPALGTSDYLSMLFYSGSEALDRKRARTSALNLSVWAPGNGFKFYSQYLLEHVTALDRLFSDDVSVLLGFWFPRLSSKGTELRVEYVHTVPGAYGHSVWRQGWVYGGSPLGHPLGEDAEGLYADLLFAPYLGWRNGVKLFYESRARNPARGIATEWRYGLGLESTRRVGKWELTLSGKYANARNHLYQAGDNANLFAGFGTLRYSFF